MNEKVVNEWLLLGGIMSASLCYQLSPKPPWFLIPYAILLINTCSGWLWYRVGKVNSKAQVDAVGKTFFGWNLNTGSQSNPWGGTNSEPVKNASIWFKETPSWPPKKVISESQCIKSKILVLPATTLQVMMHIIIIVHENVFFPFAEWLAQHLAYSTPSPGPPEDMITSWTYPPNSPRTVIL